MTTYLIVGVLCIAGGAMLVSFEKERVTSKIQVKGVLSALGGAFCWGVSGVLIKPALGEIGSPFAATFISYVAASVTVAFTLLRQGQRDQLIQLRRPSLIPLVIAGTLASLAQLLRYTALSYSPVSIVNPLGGTTGLFLFLFSFLLNRNIEVFTWKVFVGMGATVVGTFLLFQ